MRSTPSSPSPAELELAVSALTATCTRQIFWLEDELVGSPEAVKSCLNHGFKPQVNEKHTPQDMSVLHETGLMKIARVGHPECLQLFLSKTTPDKKPQTPADTRLRHARPGESLGTTAFERALQRTDAGQRRCVHVLVTQDPLNTWVDVASTPLATPEALETMLKEAADINATNRDGKTMLFVAVNFGSHSFASALVKSGATVGDDVLVNLADNDRFVTESTTLLEQILSSAKPPALPAKALIAAARKADKKRLGVILGAIIGGKTHVEHISEFDVNNIPPEWQKIFLEQNVTKKDLKKHKEAVLQALIDGMTEDEFNQMPPLPGVTDRVRQRLSLPAGQSQLVDPNRVSWLTAAIEEDDGLQLAQDIMRTAIKAVSESPQINKSAVVEEMDGAGRTLLLFAVQREGTRQRDAVDCVKFCLEHGAKIRVDDKDAIHLVRCPARVPVLTAPDRLTGLTGRLPAWTIGQSWKRYSTIIVAWYASLEPLLVALLSSCWTRRCRIAHWPRPANGAWSSS